jgi:hypothetical protein
MDSNLAFQIVELFTEAISLQDLQHHSMTSSSTTQTEIFPFLELKQLISAV